MTGTREKLASRLGFIFLSAGCAIGLGNVWRFPYVAGKSGGGWFVVIYLFCLAILGLPVLVMEFAAGRAAQRSIVKMHAAIAPDKRLWSLHGVAGVVGNSMLMMFYTTVTGWMLIYFCKMASGAFVGFDPAAVGKAFVAMLGDPLTMGAAMLVVTFLATAVCSIGLQRGVERVTKWMMALLLVLILVLAANSIWLDARDGSPDGLLFFLVPDFARMQEVGVVRVIVEAMNHSFFTLSIGIGAMAIFGSYIGRSRRLLGEAVNVAALDTFVAIASGLVILPACFAFGISADQGPGLIFVTLPNVFNVMPYGRVWGMLFFIFMSCAALTTVIAVFEAILASLMDAFGWSRPKSSLMTGLALAVLACPCVLGFNVWSGFHPFGADSCVLDLEDFLVSDLLLPLGSICFALFCCHRYGWGWKGFLAEANAGTGLRFPVWLRAYCAYVLPLIVTGVLVLGLARRFGYVSF